MTVLENIGILGAGKMGAGVAERLAVEGFHAVLVDTKPEFLERALENIERRLEERAASDKIIYPEETAAILSRIHGTTDSSNLSKVPFIIECIPEEREIKHDTLRRIAPICQKETIFSTSITSSTVSELAEGLPFSERLVGMHLFEHPAKNQLVEIVSTRKSTKRAAQVLAQVARMMGGIVIRSADAPGFIVKRLSAAFYSEAVRILNEGVANIPTIDAAVNAAFNVDAGPFSRMNEQGLEVALFASQGLRGRLPGLYTQPERLRAQSTSGERWELQGEIDEDKLTQVSERFSGLAILVGTSIVDDGVAKAEDVDLGAKYGLGWARGPFGLLNRLGLRRARALAASVAETRHVPMPKNLTSLSERKGPTWPPEHVETIIRDNIAHITIQRPDKVNVLDAETVSQLESALKKAEKNDQVGIILFSGLGSTLASGPPRECLVKNIEENNIEAIITHYRKIHALFSKIANSKKITIARARGLTMGGGVELGLACKYLVASSRALFSFPETGQGIHPGLGIP